MNKEVLNEIRPAAAMASLFGSSRYAKWMQPEIETGMHLNGEEVARMLIFFSSHVQEVKNAKSFGTKYLEYNVDKGATCVACLAVKNKVFPIKKAPEIPLKDCRCERGCRVVTTVVFD